MLVTHLIEIVQLDLLSFRQHVRGVHASSLFLTVFLLMNQDNSKPH